MQPSARTRIKICGITRVDDALAAAEAGADAIGLVFYPGSKRAVTLQQAEAIVAAIPPFVTTVGLFVNPASVEVQAVLAAIPLDLLQFHGDEPAGFCEGFARPYLKAVRMKPDIELARVAAAYRSARGLLLDAWDSQHYGGTGKTFDWSRVKPKDAGSRIILAGGLGPANVREAIATVQPWAVDVSSGVEAAPGLKSAELIKSFVSEVQRV